MTTPMQTLKNQFDDFKTILTAVGFTEMTLNKSNPKTAYTSIYGEYKSYENKGVKSDFVKLFQIKFNKEKSYSIGFVFKYLDIPEAEQSVVISIKEGSDNFLKSKHYSISDFKENFKNIIEEIKSQNDINYSSIIDTLKTSFTLSPSIHKFKRSRKKIK